MDVQARSFRGFTIVGRGVPQETVDRAREEVEAILEKHGVTAAEIDAFTRRLPDIGMGVDLQRFTAADWRRFGVDPKLVRADKHVSAALNAALNSAPAHPGRSLGFKVETAHA